MSIYTEDDLRQALVEEAMSTPPPIDAWNRLRRRVTIRRWTRAGVAVSIAGVAAVAAISALPGAGDEQSKLGIANGSTLTWTPDRPLTGAELRQAMDVVRHRLDALGVSGATIQTEQGALTITAPKLAPPLASGIMTVGVVQLRPVLAVQPPGQHVRSAAEASTPRLSAAEQAYADAACPSQSPDSGLTASPSDYLIACSQDGTAEYLLGPAALDNADVADAQAVHDQNAGDWLVDVDFTAAGGRDFQELTAAAAAKPNLGNCGPPRGCNGIGFVVDGVVLSAPRVQQPGGIRGGQTQITSTLTEDEARLLAALAASSPLPAAFSTTR